MQGTVLGAPHDDAVDTRTEAVVTRSGTVAERLNTRASALFQVDPDSGAPKSEFGTLAPVKSNGFAVSSDGNGTAQSERTSTGGELST